MTESVRQRRSAQAWGELVRRQKASGLSGQAFCRREGINAWVFYRWRARLRAQGARPPESRPVPLREAVPFIDLGALRSAAAQRWEVRLDLGGGLVLHLVRG